MSTRRASLRLAMPAFPPAYSGQTLPAYFFLITTRPFSVEKLASTPPPLIVAYIVRSNFASNLAFAPPLEVTGLLPVTFMSKSVQIEPWKERIFRVALVSDGSETSMLPFRELNDRGFA